jgi:sugar phosphate permease
MHYLETGNVASVSGMMDFATYLGGGVASMVYGVVIKNFGYLPMFVSWIVLSLASMLVIYKIAKNRKRQAELQAV